MLANTANLKASREQIRCIYGLARNKGIDNDLLHEKCKALTGEEHISKLTGSQAGRLIDSLMGKKRDFQPVEHVQQRPISRASQEQIKLIFGLAKKLGWLEGGDKKRVTGFIREQYGVEHIDWMDPEDARKCIEALKAMVAGGRRERKGYHAEGNTNG